jgi:serine/threonine-protein kinase
VAPTDQLFASRYRLERRLGVGGMSTVQLAFDTRLERYVAVKLLAEHLAEDSGFVARFRREALAAARLVHPNVVQVFDFGLDEASGRHSSSWSTSRASRAPRSCARKAFSIRRRRSTS